MFEYILFALGTKYDCLKCVKRKKGVHNPHIVNRDQQRVPSTIVTQSIIFIGKVIQKKLWQYTPQDTNFLKFARLRHFASRKYKTFGREDPLLLIKYQSGLPIVNFEPCKELSEILKLKYILRQKITLEISGASRESAMVTLLKIQAYPQKFIESAQIH